MAKIQELNTYAVLFNGKQVLVLKRKNDLWEFPGGGVDWGEHPDKTVLREVKEETGIEMRNPIFIGISSATYEKDGNEKHSIYFVYKGETTDKTVKITAEEHKEYRWLLLEELRFLKLGLNAETVLDLL